MMIHRVIGALAVIAPRASVIWVPPHWAQRSGGCVFVTGHWKQRGSSLQWSRQDDHCGRQEHATWSDCENAEQRS